MPVYTKNPNCINCKKKNDLFCLLTSEELAQVNDRKYEVIFESGETILKEGSPITHIACITDGLVKIHIEGINKKRILLRLARAGDILGGPGFLTDNLHHFTATAVEDTRICLVDVEMFKHYLEKNSDFTFGLIKRINNAVINNFNTIINLTQKQMPGKVATAILYLYNVVYKTNPFYLTISRQDIADLASMTKESLIRVLKDLRDNEIIDLKGNELKILKIEALKELSEKG